MNQFGRSMRKGCGPHFFDLFDQSKGHRNGSGIGYYKCYFDPLNNFEILPLKVKKNEIFKWIWIHLDHPI